MINTKTVYLAALPFLLLCACAKPGATTATTAQNTLLPAQIVNKTWQVEDINQRGIIDDARITLILGDDDRIYGKSGCNSYSGQYKLTGKKLTVIPNMASTMMMCAPALMELEREYLTILNEAEKVELSSTNALILTDKNGKAITFMTSDAAQADVKK